MTCHVIRPQVECDYCGYPIACPDKVTPGQLEALVRAHEKTHDLEGDL